MTHIERQYNSAVEQQLFKDAREAFLKDSEYMQGFYRGRKEGIIIGKESEVTIEHYCKQSNPDGTFSKIFYLECGCAEYVCEVCSIIVTRRPDGGCGNNKDHTTVLAAKTIEFNKEPDTMDCGG